MGFVKIYKNGKLVEYLMNGVDMLETGLVSPKTFDIPYETIPDVGVVKNLDLENESTIKLDEFRSEIFKRLNDKSDVE